MVSSSSIEGRRLWYHHQALKDVKYGVDILPHTAHVSVHLARVPKIVTVHHQLSTTGEQGLESAAPRHVCQPPSPSQATGEQLPGPVQTTYTLTGRVEG
jgi:hypothetical protein